MKKMNNHRIYKCFEMLCFMLNISACTPDLMVHKPTDISIPNQYNQSTDTTNSSNISWKNYFANKSLIALIDTALINNQELNIILQEVDIARNEVRSRKGEYLPFIDIAGGAGFDKVGRYTRNGALEANTDIEHGKEFPEPLGDFRIDAYATWEVDVWRKLRNAKKSAYTKYLSSIEGKNFMITNLIAEIARAYYELLALDNQLANVKQSINIQRNALEIVKLQKQFGRVTELAVKRFEAQVLSTRSLQYEIQQMIAETENELNFLIGRYPQPIPRDSDAFNTLVPVVIQVGIPSQLLENRPDIREAELQMKAAKLDVKVAKARFYPSLGISAGVGFNAYNGFNLLKTPESLLYNLGADVIGPLVNRNAIKAMYYSANSKQIQAVYNYERTILKAYIEIVNQQSNMNNLQSSYDLKEKQVEALNESINISNNLFRSARADYMEVLLTQRDALESRFELIDTKMAQMMAQINIYRALGGGWR